MRFYGTAVVCWLLAACGDPDLLGPLPPDSPHLTVRINGQAFAAYLGSTACLGVQMSPTRFFVDVHTDQSGLPSLALYFEHVTGPGSFAMASGSSPTPGASANYLVSTTPELQYSSRSGVMRLDEYDPAARTLAGRFSFNAERVVGNGGAQSLEFRQGSFRGVLRPWPPGPCL